MYTVWSNYFQFLTYKIDEMINKKQFVAERTLSIEKMDMKYEEFSPNNRRKELQFPLYTIQPMK